MYKHKILSVKTQTLSDKVGRLSIILCWLQKLAKLLILLFYQELKILHCCLCCTSHILWSLHYCCKGTNEKPLTS